MIRFYEVLCSQHMERKATCEMRGFFISTISMPYLLRVKVSLFIFLKSPSFCNLGTRFLLRRGRGGGVTPCVMETLITSLKLQLRPKARANQVTKV
jgi:hypothetical protein